MSIKPDPIQLHRRAIYLYMIIIALAAIGNGFSDGVLANYFKDAYAVTAEQRGFIEFPRELPGIIVFIVVSYLASLGDIRTAIVAQFLSIVGLALLGFLTPPYTWMLFLIFVQSMGQHIWYPLQDSIGMSLIRDEQNAGQTIGRFKGISTGFSMLAALLVFAGFRLGLFSFTTPVKVTFLLAGGAYILTWIVLTMLARVHHQFQASLPANRAGQAAKQATLAGPADPAKVERGLRLMPRLRFVLRREYRYYYILAILFGVQKQIMLVYAPWVLIDLLGKKADTLAMLGMIGSFIGMFFIPQLGRWQDRFGIKKMLYLDAFSFIGVYAAYGLLTAGFTSGALVKIGLPVILTYALFIIDRMSMQMGMIRAMYLRAIARDPADIAPTLTIGQSMDHVVSITCAVLGGIVWSKWGAQYVFFAAALLSLANYAVARAVVIAPRPASRQPSMVAGPAGSHQHPGQIQDQPDQPEQAG